ncbi:MAG: hypothetical protein RMJ60_10020, partial [Anaerolineales bacterium]|nr:hypothetical protein [Anaerolineales bacterium]
LAQARPPAATGATPPSPTLSSFRQAHSSLLFKPAPSFNPSPPSPQSPQTNLNRRTVLLSVNLTVEI